MAVFKLRDSLAHLTYGLEDGLKDLVLFPSPVFIISDYCYKKVQAETFYKCYKHPKSHTDLPWNVTRIVYGN